MYDYFIQFYILQQTGYLGLYECNNNNICYNGSDNDQFYDYSRNNYNEYEN